MCVFMLLLLLKEHLSALSGLFSPSVPSNSVTNMLTVSLLLLLLLVLLHFDLIGAADEH